MGYIFLNCPRCGCMGKLRGLSIGPSSQCKDLVWEPQNSSACVPNAGWAGQTWMQFSPGLSVGKLRAGDHRGKGREEEKKGKGREGGSPEEGREWRARGAGGSWKEGGGSPARGGGAVDGLGGIHEHSLSLVPHSQRSKALFPEEKSAGSHPSTRLLPICSFPPAPNKAGSRCPPSGTTCHHEGPEVMLSLGNPQRAAMSHFVCFSSWNRRSVGERKQAKVRDPMNLPLTTLSRPAFPPHSPGVLELLHIPAALGSTHTCCF